MTALVGCPRCTGWMRWNDLLCSECSGANTRKSYQTRMANFCAGLHAAAIEEMRFRATRERIAAERRRKP